MTRKKTNSTQVVRKICQVLFLGMTAFSLIRMDLTTTGIMLLLSLLGGAFCCGWMCPFGFLQESLAVLGRRILPRGRNPKLPAGLDRILRSLRYALLLIGGASLLGIMLPDFLLKAASPLQVFNALLKRNVAYVEPTAWTLFGFVALLSVFTERPFCRYLCPQGALHGLAGLGRVFTIKRNPEACVSCGICDAACPAHIRISEISQMRNPQCINCLQCLSSCRRHKALKFGFLFDRKHGGAK